MFETRVEAGVFRARRAGTDWLSSGWNGGRSSGAVAYNVSVPEGWAHEDLPAYVKARRDRAGFPEPGPTLLTGVDLDHLRGARLGSVVAYATAGMSNPAALPVTSGHPTTDGRGENGAEGHDHGPGETDDPGERVGTINLIVGTTRCLVDGGLANLLATAVEAKTTTTLAETGFPGTTTDAAVVGCDPSGEPTPYAGSATRVGTSVRACVREATHASLRSRHDGDYPESVADANHGVRTERRAEVFQPGL